MAWTTQGTDRKAAAATTVDATPTVVLTYIVRGGQASWLEITVIGRKTATADYLVMRERGVATEASGAATWSSQQQDTARSGGAAAWVVAVAASASTITVTVTGVAANTIDWRVSVEGEHAEN